MTFPARQGTAFEIIVAEFVVQFLVLLFDGPALVRQADKGP
jgi:hypothetical protein